MGDRRKIVIYDEIQAVALWRTNLRIQRLYYTVSQKKHPRCFQL